MSPSAIALAVIFAIVALGTAIGFYAGARRKMDLEQWTVAGRGFGVLLVWLLMAGEVYTTFAFLGASGWAYSRGGPVLYILAYLTLAYVVSFFILPPIWELGRRHRPANRNPTSSPCATAANISAPSSRVVGVVFIIPYLQLQLTGLGIIVEVASFDGIGRNTAMAIAVVLMAGFVSPAASAPSPGSASSRTPDAVRRGRDRHRRAPHLLRRHRPDVRRARPCPARPPHHARRHRKPRPRLVSSPPFC